MFHEKKAVDISIKIATMFDFIPKFSHVITITGPLFNPNQIGF